MDAKHAAAQGRLCCKAYYQITPDDPRVVDCTVGTHTRRVVFGPIRPGGDCTVGTHTRLCVRPWVESRRVGRYPMEFRIFVTAGPGMAISDYYPQRELTKHAADVPRMLYSYINALRSVRGFPHGFSVDFIVTEHGIPVFLEGGPPHLAEPPPGCPSAHPCCFAPGKTRGIAMTPRKGALTE